MEYAPVSLDVTKLRQKISMVASVVDLHVWCISEERVCLTTHLTIDSAEDYIEKLTKVKHIAESEFKIYHSTIQIKPV